MNDVVSGEAVSDVSRGRHLPRYTTRRCIYLPLKVYVRRKKRLLAQL